jgi:hypothetical protein
MLRSLNYTHSGGGAVGLCREVIIGGTSILTPHKFTSRLASVSGGDRRGNADDIEVGDASSSDESSD